VSDPARLAEIAAGDDELVRDERLAMKLDGRSVRLGVVDPDDVAALSRQSPEEPVAGADVEQVPRDRGGREDSASRVYAPAQDSGIGAAADGRCRSRRLGQNGLSRGEQAHRSQKREAAASRERHERPFDIAPGYCQMIF
jgi:hypothetical protein